MNRLGTIVAIAFITIILMVALTYLVAPKNDTKSTKIAQTPQMNYDTLPKQIELVGIENLVQLQSVMQSNSEYIIAIANQDALPIIASYKKFYPIEFQYITVANVSQAPWILKKLGIQPLLEKINQESATPMVYDSNGWFARSFSNLDSDPTKYFIYRMNTNNTIEFLFFGKVPSGLILEEKIDENTIKEELEKLHQKLQSFRK